MASPHSGRKASKLPSEACKRLLLPKNVLLHTHTSIRDSLTHMHAYICTCYGRCEQSEANYPPSKCSSNGSFQRNNLKRSVKISWRDIPLPYLCMKKTGMRVYTRAKREFANSALRKVSRPECRFLARYVTPDSQSSTQSGVGSSEIQKNQNSSKAKKLTDFFCERFFAVSSTPNKHGLLKVGLPRFAGRSVDELAEHKNSTKNNSSFYSHR